MPTATTANQPARPLTWAMYLACSWTWCIGMFLPAILLRDLGLWSFVVFAVPNIVGAAALAWVMPTPESSRVLLREHKVAVWLFSSLTVAFQVYFASWVGTQLPQPWGYVMPALLITAALAPGGLSRSFHVTSFITWALSTVGIIYVLATQGMPALSTRGSLPAGELWPMAAVCTLGFLLCPYLDTTFHRARVEADRSATTAFGLGFGWFFAAMILGTLVVSPLLLTIARSELISLRTPLVVFMLLCTGWQLLYTVRVHAMEQRRGRVGGLRLGFALPAILVALATFFGPSLALAYADLRLGEVVYRSFMSLYGLAFPAYVLCCMWPVSGADGLRVTRPTPGRLAFWFAAVVAATPFYWLAFIERQTWWAIPGIAIVLMAGLGSAIAVRRADAPV